MRGAFGIALLVLSALACEGEETRLTLGQQCDLTSECEAPLACRLARCRVECRTTRDCPVGQLCVMDNDGLGACLLADETECERDSECPAPLVCLGGACTNECTIDRDCAPGARCERDSAGARYCADPAEEHCLVDSECAPLVCGRDFRCRHECVTSRDCPPGTRCSDGVCDSMELPADGGVDAGVDTDAAVGMDASAELDGGSGDMDASTTSDGGSGTVSCTTPADCSAPGVAVADCVSGSCTIASCGTGLADCDGEFTSGCEIDTRSDPTSCGACGASCGVWGRCGASSCDGLVDMSIAGAHACWVRGSGLVLCTGDNYSGALGVDRVDVDYVTDPYPVWMVTDGVRAETGTSVTTGASTTCIQHADGRLGCFGSNEDGQLGDGTFTRRLRPVEPVGLGSVSDLSMGGRTGCAIRTGGSLYCWGYGQCGENGQGSAVLYATTPGMVAGVTGATDVSVWEQHACAVQGDGAVKCWGENSQGQLGDGVTDHADFCRTTTDASFTPVTVSGITDGEEVGVGHLWSCARRSGGTVECWGRNWGGWGTAMAGLSSSPTPLPVVGLTGAAQLAVGYDHACAVRTDGTVACWGRNGWGQLGAGDLGTYDDAVAVTGLTDVVEVAAGRESTCARRSSGEVRCWGTHDGQLGPDFQYDWRASPTPIDSLFP